MSVSSAARWPADFLPGDTDNFVSNEVIVKNVSASDVWPKLIDTSLWSSFHKHHLSAKLPNGETRLKRDLEFEIDNLDLHFRAKIIEIQPPTIRDIGRLTWKAQIGPDDDPELISIHAFIVEDLPGYRVRVSTQQSQRGPLAVKLSNEKPNRLLLWQQDWLQELVETSRSPVRG